MKGEAAAASLRRHDDGPPQVLEPAVAEGVWLLAADSVTVAVPAV